MQVISIPEAFLCPVRMDRIRSFQSMCFGGDMQVCVQLLRLGLTQILDVQRSSKVWR